MNRRRALALASGSLALPLVRPLLGAADRLEKAGPDKPNVIFIFCDDWGWGDLSRHASPFVRTPNLDRFFSQGREFTQFHVNAPVCSPSRAALLTGHFPGRHRVFSVYHGDDSPKNRERGMNDWLDPEPFTVPKMMKQAGYVTAHFGKWHLGSVKGHSPSLREYGYDESLCWHGAPPTMGHHAASHPEGPVGSAMRFIEKHRDERFFVNMWLHETHLKHQPRPETLRLDWIRALPEEQRVYAAVCWDADEALGRLFDRLRDLGLEEDTLVFFSSDNGPEKMRENGREADRRGFYGAWHSRGTTGGQKGRKRSHHGGGVRTPFAVRWPGRIGAGGVDKTSILSAVDILPTLSAIVGVDIPAGHRPDGENVLPALRGKPFSRTRPIMWEQNTWNFHQDDPDNPLWANLAVIDGGWKLMTTFDKKRVELYHVIDDWEESENLAEARPEIVERLMKIADSYRASLPPRDRFDPRLCAAGDRKQ